MVARGLRGFPGELHSRQVETLLGTFAWADQRLAESAAWVTAALALYVLASSLDDLVLDVLWLAGIGRLRVPALSPERERRIAILVPLWREAEVIGRMLEHNVSAIRYGNFEILAGVYANDEETRRAVQGAAARLPQVSLAEVPHDGPTSKADCLNWAYQRLLERENSGAPRAEIVMIHDAEDLIHPDSLERINRYADQAGMIQVPVLALPTPWTELTHGVYCDDFAESQAKDLGVRVGLGGFLPGCGVGTAFRRDELDRLAEAESNRLFDPLSMTEDYDNGMRMFRLGCRQIFLPLEEAAGGPVATREYFPREFGAAVRQRTRWITGNCLQAWERHGWGRGMQRPWLQAWMLWRDRKGLWGSWAGLACNVLLVWGACGWAASVVLSGRWSYGAALDGVAWLGPLLGVNLALCCERVAMRAYCSSRVYGWRFALSAPLRMMWGNLINAAASGGALWQFARAKWTGRPLRWLKTEHCYPSLEALKTWAATDPVAAAEMAACGAAPFAGRGGRDYQEQRAGGGWRRLDGMEADDAMAWGSAAAPPAARRLLRAVPAGLGDRLQAVATGFRDGRLEVAAAKTLTQSESALLSRCAGAPVHVRRVSFDTYQRLIVWRDAPAAGQSIARRAVEAIPPPRAGPAAGPRPVVRAASASGRQ